MAQQIIVVGGGLAGLSAAHTCLERGCNVLVIDKNPFFGGNSTKATSGINGAGTRSQRAKGISDAPEVFEEDTIRGGAKSAPHAHVLTFESGPGVEWLQDAFNLDLSIVGRMGGHSNPRCHRGAAKFPGMTITYALMEKLEDIAEKEPKRARIMLKARMKKILKEGDKIVGLEIEQGGKTFVEKGPVVLATGGYGADQTDDSILKKYRPELTGMPTTCGEHCTGDGIKLGMRDAGAAAVDLNYVQVHPTGLVNPKEPDAKVLFLAAEALRGCGGVLLDCEGNRFANELGRRDYVSNRMFDCKKGPYRLCLNSKASSEIAWHIKHYRGRGLMKEYKTMKELADEMKIDVNAIKKTFDEHNDIESKYKANPDGGPYDAYGGGKTFDQWGKKFFNNGPLSVDDTFNVAIVTPVVHYTMGGIKVNPDAQVQKEDNTIVPGLFGAGEVNGGIHGENRLGGSSLLDCVVYGRVAGRSAAKHLMESNLEYLQAKM